MDTTRLIKLVSSVSFSASLVVSGAASFGANAGTTSPRFEHVYCRLQHRWRHSLRVHCPKGVFLLVKKSRILNQGSSALDFGTVL